MDYSATSRTRPDRRELSSAACAIAIKLKRGIEQTGQLGSGASSMYILSWH
jgi:hypothetical protein